MKTKLYLLATLVFFLHSTVGYSELKLNNRYIYYYTDAALGFTGKSVANWNKSLTYLNGQASKATATVGEWGQYKVPTDSGVVEIMLYKGQTSSSIETNVKIEVLHNGVTDVSYADFSATREGWMSVGKYYFSGKGTEYFRFTKQSASSSVIMPVLPVRYDLYADTKTRDASDLDLSSSIGFSSSGSWSDCANAGYCPAATPKYSKVIGTTACWNPGKIEAGKTIVYVYKPVVETNDKYEVIHNSKVDIVYLKNQKGANYSVVSPGPLVVYTNATTKMGWFKLGEFDFDGSGKECVRLTKTTSDSTYVDCISFENVKYEGTILNRTVVTTNPYNGGLFTGTLPVTLDAKEKAATVIPGFSPQFNSAAVQLSSHTGSTPYSRAFYIPGGSSTYYWNPLILEPGDYEFRYFNYWDMGTNPVFTVKSGGTSKSVSMSSSAFKKDTFTPVGTFTFNGDVTDEYIQMTGVNRAADIVLEKKVSNSAILKQIVVTVHPYFKETVFSDTKGAALQHDVSVLVNKGFVAPLDETIFGVDAPMTRGDFIRSMAVMLGYTPDASLPNYTDILPSNPLKGYIGIAKRKGLLYGIADTGRIYPNQAITREEAAQIFLNGMENVNRYTNVKNLFKAKAATILSAYSDGESVQPFAKEAFARMVDARILKIVTNNKLLPAKALTRSEAVIILKEYYETIVGSGPSNRKTDWELTFREEFDGDKLDFTKWSCDNYVRFAGVSGKWKENVVVEDGVFKGYNYLDNHTVPYSSGNISSKFTQVRGFFEARYKYPDKAYGSHSSFWSGGGTSGDNNYNEGAFPNSIGTNNYFLAEPNRTFGFYTQDNLAKDFHTNGGYTGVNDIYYTWDGKPFGIVSDLSTKWATPGTSSTNAAYPALVSTIVSYFDGPLDRDRIDGSYMACDWVRVYKETVWKPEVLIDEALPVHNATNQPVSVSPVLKFNKAMDAVSINPSTIAITNEGGGNVSGYTIEQVTPLRFRIRFANALQNGTRYNVTVKSTVVDIIGNTMAHDTILSFTTVDAKALSVSVSANTPVKMGSAIELTSNVSGGIGNYSTYAWSGPDGFISNLPNPTIQGATLAKAGVYSLTVTDSQGGKGTAEIFVAVDATSGISENAFLRNPSIFPNPSKGIVTVSDPLFATSQSVFFSVNDLSGKVLYQQKTRGVIGCNSVSLDVSFLKQGMYILQLNSKNVQKSLKLVIKK